MLTDLGASIMSPVYWAGKQFRGGLGYSCGPVLFSKERGQDPVVSSGMSYRSFHSLLL